MQRYNRSGSFENMQRRVNSCIEVGGEHFEHFLSFSIKLHRIPPPPGGTAILPEYIHYYG
jgi:hypothetical protein